MVRNSKDFPDRDAVANLVASASRLLTMNFMMNLSVTGVTPAQLFVLRELMVGHPLTQSEIARNIQVSRASVGETLARLEKSGLVKRKRSKDDGRTILPSLTPRAVALMDHLIENAHGQDELVRSIISADDEALLKSILQRLVAGVQEHLDQSGESIALKFNDGDEDFVATL